MGMLFRERCYADDQDDLPTWFERYWFGKFLAWSTATVTAPGVDPDNDGQANLQEYPAQTDPTTPPAPCLGHLADFALPQPAHHAARADGCGQNDDTTRRGRFGPKVLRWM